MPRLRADVPNNGATRTERNLPTLTGLAGVGVVDYGWATVKTHVNRLFAELALRDRVQAVVLAYERGLIQPGETGAPGNDDSTTQ